MRFKQSPGRLFCEVEFAFNCPSLGHRGACGESPSYGVWRCLIPAWVSTGRWRRVGIEKADRQCNGWPRTPTWVNCLFPMIGARRSQPRKHRESIASYASLVLYSECGTRICSTCIQLAGYPSCSCQQPKLNP